VDYLNKEIKAALQSRSISAKISNAGKIVRKFDSSNASKSLFDFLRLHPSCRVAFNAMVKSGLIDLESALIKLDSLSKAAETEFRVAAKCRRCEKILDIPYLADSNFRIKEEKHITCPNCNTSNTLTSSSYVPFREFKKPALIRVLKKGEEIGLFNPSVTVQCLICDFTEYPSQKDTFNLNLKCPKCGAVREALLQYVPAYSDEIKSLMRDDQGYWLEWYVWKLISNTFPAEPGLKLSKNNQTLEADVVCLAKKKLSIVQCKDSPDAGDFLKKISLMNEIADKVLLVTTTSIHPDVLATAKNVLGKKFIHVGSKRLECICKMI
jgi:Zn finger protein HypA/HybF involved in hydrogenase expression